MRSKLISLFVLILLAIILILRPRWVPWIGGYLVVSDPLQRVDALVILAGDENERIAYAAHLYHQGYADWLVITDMYIKPDAEGRYSSVVKSKAVSRQVPEERILIVPDTVKTTYEEAVGIRKFVTSHGLHSLIVVTSPYHSRRARWILNQVFDRTDVLLIIHPVQDHSYRPEGWWQSPEGRNFTASEYMKLAAHLFGVHHLDQLPYELEK